MGAGGGISGQDKTDSQDRQVTVIGDGQADGNAKVAKDAEGNSRLFVESKPKEDIQTIIRDTEVQCLLKGILDHLIILNQHMECVTGLTDMESEPKKRHFK